MLRLVTGLVWALAAASAVYWGLRASEPTQAVVLPDATSPAPTGDASARQTAIAGLLGAPQSMASTAERPGPAERFALLGVISSLAGQGAALIAADGKPARPFVVGAEIAPGYLLKAVGPREAMLADGLNAPVRTTLSLPPQAGGNAAAASAVPGVLGVLGVPAALASPAPPAPPAAAPVAAAKEQSTDTGPPARADARHQPPATSRREGRVPFNTP